MHYYPATTKVIKAGHTNSRFLLFTGSRKHEENRSRVETLIDLFIPLLMALATILLGITLCLFFSGRLS